jgi:nonsense-mediated mRNA decay protein 3
MKAICPRCGVPSAEGLCNKCALQSVIILKCPEKIELVVCSTCGSVFAKGRWQINEDDIEKLALKAIKDTLKTHSELKDFEVKIRLSRIGSTRYMAYVSCKGKFRDIAAINTYEIPVIVNIVACYRCSRMAGKYYEATIQIRGSVNKPSNNDLKECIQIAKDLEDACYREGDQLSFIQEIRQTKRGLDLILGSTQLGRKIAKTLIKRSGGKILETNKLIGKKDGRDVFRTTILIRLPKFKRGDLVSWRGDVFEVTGFEGKNTQIISINDGRKSSISEDDAERAELLGNRTDSLKAMIVSSDKNALEIIDPQSFRTTFASKPTRISGEPGDEITILRTAKGLIVLG